MKERPILFSAPMVHALLAGTKTQTRRVAKLTTSARVREPGSNRNWHPDDPNASLACPYGQPGDRLWVKETWAVAAHHDTKKPTDLPERKMSVAYRAGGHSCNDSRGWNTFSEDASGFPIGRWRPSIFMRRWMSRLTLELVDVEAERLNDISEADAEAEGGPRILGFRDERGQHGWASYREWYKWLWEGINGPGSWAKNPYVWVIKFKRITS